MDKLMPLLSLKDQSLFAKKEKFKLHGMDSIFHQFMLIKINVNSLRF